MTIPIRHKSENATEDTLNLFKTFFFQSRKKTLSWRTAGSNGNVSVFHLVATTISPAFSSWSDPRAQAKIRDDLTATAIPHLRRKAMKGRLEMGRWSTVLQATAQDPLCLLFLNVFESE